MHAKDQKIRERSARFRDEYVAATPGWYRGEMHLGFTLLFTGGVIAWCLFQIEDSRWQEWMIALPIFLFGNWAEWAAHRYLLHRPASTSMRSTSATARCTTSSSPTSPWSTRDRKCGAHCCSRRSRR
ncbi:hypothetical protein [Massilia alkalitolerans]|uniref:hypothetical protein n=1 Tax=Massilia alkalitolerans TaxID=286638 RepID=UPI0028B0ADC0|nr:hypothetical protein [Massilia alkalitolerans]